MRKRDIIEYVLTAIFMLFLICAAKTAFGQHKINDVVAGINPEKAAVILERMEKEEREIDLLAHLIYAENGDDSFAKCMQTRDRLKTLFETLARRLELKRFIHTDSGKPVQLTH